MIYFQNLHRPDKPGVVMHIMMKCLGNHYTDVTMSAMAQITSVAIVYSTVGPDADKKKKPPKLRVTGVCVGNSPVTREFPSQKASNAENVSIWWRHRDFLHMAFWMESFDFPNTLHWRHMGAMASRVTGNSTDYSAAHSGKQVRRQIVHITDPLWGESTSH